MKNFSGKVAAITGAGSGMGRALAHALAAEGCHLSLSDVSDEGLAETATGCADNVNVTTHHVDVSDRHQVEAWAQATVSEHKSINLLFNNAGVSVTDSVENLSYEDFEWLMNINFWGVVYCCKAFLPELKRASEAHIVNTSSIFGVISVPTQSAYNASKFAVRGFSEAMRMELKDSSVGVTTIMPGGVKTNIVNSSRYKVRDNEAPTREELVQQFEQMAQLTPDQAVDQILKGVRKGKARVLVGKDAKFMALLERLAPVGYTKLLTGFLGN